MNKKVNGCAVIEIGSNNVSMAVYQNQKNKLSTLDSLEYPLSLGHEVFNFGEVSFSTINELNNVLSKYKTACASYGIDNISVVSTTVMRESKNSHVLADRVFTQNGLEIEVLPDSKEKTLIFFDLLQRLKSIEKTYKNAVIAYIGSGSMGISKFDGENITQTSYIPLGSVKFHDILKSLKSEMSDYHLVIEEYLHTVFAKMDFSDCDCLILVGSEMDEIATMCNATVKNEIYTFEKDELKKVYYNLRDLTGSNIAYKYNMDEEKANMLTTALSICYELTRSIKIKTSLMASSVNLKKLVANTSFMPQIATLYSKHIYENCIHASLLQAEKFNCDIHHISAVRAIAINLFEKLQKLHGLGSKYRLILELASILHSCGQYINTRQRTISSFDLIKNLDIYGLTKEEILLVAYVSSYNELSVPSSTDYDYSPYTVKNKMVISKLIAIFRIANALDKSQKGKIEINKIKINNDFIDITATSLESAQLEKWAFHECSEYFRDTFGTTPRLTIKYTSL